MCTIINTGQKALVNLQAQHPDCWLMLIEEAKRKIKVARKQHKLKNDHLGNLEAAKHCMTIGSGTTTAYALLAAVHLMDATIDVQAMHIDAEMRLLRVEEQMARLDKANWNDRDKAEIRSYYIKCKSKLNITINACIGQIKVRGATIVATEPRMPGYARHSLN